MDGCITLKPMKKAAGKSTRTKSRVPTWIGRIDECARELNIGERYVYDLQKRGLPRVKPGRYNIPKCFRWYVRYLQRKLVERALPENGNGSIAGAAAGEMRHKLLSIEAEMKSIELAEKREQLISIERVQKTSRRLSSRSERGSSRFLPGSRPRSSAKLISRSRK
jgi:hypothetical protein